MSLSAAALSYRKPAQPMKAAVFGGTTQAMLCIYYRAKKDFVFIEYTSFWKGCVMKDHV